jgi:hypothetical protein
VFVVAAVERRIMDVQETEERFIATEKTYAAMAIGALWTSLAGLAVVGAVRLADPVALVVTGVLLAVGLAIVVFSKPWFRLVVDRENRRVTSSRQSPFGFKKQHSVDFGRVVAVRLGNLHVPYQSMSKYSVDLILDDDSKLSASFLMTLKIDEAQLNYARSLADYLRVPFELKP